MVRVSPFNLITLALVAAFVVLPVAAWSNAEDRFDTIYLAFFEERDAVEDGSAARALRDRLEATLPADDVPRRIQFDVVDCFYGHFDDLPAQQLLGEQGAERAQAHSMYREAALFRICQADAVELLEGSSHALPLFRDAVALAERSGDPYSIAVAGAWLGSVLSVLGSSGEALAELLQAQAGFAALGRAERARTLDIDIAILYRRIGRLDRSEAIFRDLLSEFDSDSSTSLEDQLAVLIQLTYVLNLMERWEESLHYSIEAQRRLGDRALPLWQSTVLAAPAVALNALGRHEEALDRLDQALMLYNEMGGDSLVDLELRRAEALLGLGRIEDALSLLDALSGSPNLVGSPVLSLEWQLARAAALFAAGSSEQAYEQLLRARALDRQLHRENNAQQLIALQSGFETRDRVRALEQAETQARLRQAQLDASQRIQSWQRLTLVVLAMLLVALLVWGSQQRGQRRRMSDLARRDPLTGLANRRGFLDQAEQVFRARDPNRPAPALLAIDLDYFKQINDRHGHPAGDQVLVAVGEVLRASARTNDLIGRLGGEEFSLVLPDAAGAEAVTVAERLRNTLAEKCFDDIAPDLRLSCSIGVAMADEPGVASLGDMMILADRRLYAAKTSGRNRVVSTDGSDCRGVDARGLTDPAG